MYGLALGLALGYAVGERMRRLDVQWRERVARPPGWRPPLLHNRQTAAEPSDVDNDLVRERMIRDAMADGLSLQEAEADVDNLLAQARQDAPNL